MKKIIKLCFLLITIVLNSQTNRFYYQVLFKPDYVNVKKDLVVLDINSKDVLFYSNEYLLIDSLNSTNNNFKFAYPVFKPIVKKKFTNSHFTFVNSLSPNYYFVNAQKEIEWEIRDGKKKIGNYNVQEAKGEYGGRTWIAWFSTEIPLPYGPYTFHGLPGLILEVYDSQDHYHFTFAQNKNLLKDFDGNGLISKYIGVNEFNITEVEWEKIQRNYYSNPIPDYIGGTGMITKKDGSAYTIDDYKKLEQKIQSGIKKNNNPIELSNKLIYD